VGAGHDARRRVAAVPPAAAADRERGAPRIEPRSDEGEVTIKVERVAERVRVEIVNPLAEASAPRRGNQMRCPMSGSG
jgi:hypothetical protein